MVTLEKEPPAVKSSKWSPRSWLLAFGLVGAIFAVPAIWAAVAGGSSSTGRSAEVTAQTLTPWPFTVDTGELSCEDDAVTFTAAGVRYALNGTAKDRGYAAVDGIWADDPSDPGLPLKVSLQSAIDRGLSLCQ